MKFTQKKNRGFTLIEILLVVGFIALASIGVYTIYSKVQVSNAANAESRNIDLIRAGIKTLYGSQTTYNGLTNTLISNSRIIPDNMRGSAVTSILNSFGGAVDITATNLNGGVDNGFRISYAKVPAQVCLKLAAAAAAQFDVVIAGGSNVKTLTAPAINVGNIVTGCNTDAGAGVTMTFDSL